MSQLALNARKPAAIAAPASAAGEPVDAAFGTLPLDDCLALYQKKCQPCLPPHFTQRGRPRRPRCPSNCPSVVLPAGERFSRLALAVPAGVRHVLFGARIAERREGRPRRSRRLIAGSSAARFQLREKRRPTANAGQRQPRPAARGIVQPRARRPPQGGKRARQNSCEMVFRP